MSFSVLVSEEGGGWGARSRSGTVFGFINVPVNFDITVKSPRVSRGLRLAFTCKHDPDKKPYEVERSPKYLSLDEQTTIAMTFYNPSPGAPSGLLAPAPVILLAPEQAGSAHAMLLSFMFYVDILPKATVYRLSYEFFDGELDLKSVTSSQ